MHWKLTSLWGGKKVELRETQRAVTPFDNRPAAETRRTPPVHREAVSQHLPFRLTSPNAIDPVETFMAFLLSVVAGARRFAHTSLLRADVTLHGLLGMKDGPRIIRSWRCWPKRTFSCTAGCAAETAARHAASWNSSRKPWRCCRENMPFGWSALMPASLTSNYWVFSSSAGCPISSWHD